MALALMLYVVRIFAIAAGYHRYFAHRAFSTSRICQFALAFLAQTSAQRGILWWASHHRRHHRYSDIEGDVRSPVQRDFLYAHLGWIFVPRNDATDYAAVRDLARYKELMWLDRHPYLPAALCHRREVEEQLVARTADDGRRLAQQSPCLSGIGATRIPLAGV